MTQTRPPSFLKFNDPLIYIRADRIKAVGEAMTAGRSLIWTTGDDGPESIRGVSPQTIMLMIAKALTTDGLIVTVSMDGIISFCDLPGEILNRDYP